MRFKSPSELLEQGSAERKMQEANEQAERDLEREKVTLSLIHELKSQQATGVGNKGDYYSNRGSNIGVKHLARPERLKEYENTLMQEARMQTMALIILEKARAEQQSRIDKETDPAKKEWLAKRMPARIPFVVGYARDEDAAARGEASEYIVMETVKGKTLSHLMLQKIANGLYQRDHEKYGVFAGVETWREDVVGDTLAAHVDDLKGYSKDDAAQVVYNTLHGTGLVSEAIALQVGAAVRTLNNAGLFHRDLHERNIMISEDNTQAWIIDFGSAKFDPAYGKDGPLSREAVYEVGQGIKLWNDHAAVLNLPDLTSKPNKPLKPNARRIKL